MATSPFPPDCAALFTARRLIGRGGFASVWLAQQESLDRPVAIKILDGNFAEDPAQIQRFLTEARITAALAHPNIVVILDQGCAHKVPWIAYEYVKGQSARARLAHGPLPWPEAFAMGAQVAAALEVAHERGILHRDIKPDNLLLPEPTGVKVSDFGIASWRERFLSLTAPGTLLGSPAYLAPALVRGEGPSVHTDLYALGVTLFEMVTGVLPYSDPETGRMLRLRLERPPPKPSDMLADLPAVVDDVIGRCLSEEPDVRYPDAHALRGELERVQRLAGSSGRTQAFSIQRQRSSGPSGVATVVVRAEPSTSLFRRWWWVPVAALGVIWFARRDARRVSLPPARAHAVAVPAGEYESQSWRKIKRLVPILRRGGAEARLAVQEIRRAHPGLPLGSDPGGWLYWVRIGEWLDEPVGPPPSPPLSKDFLETFDRALQRAAVSRWDMMTTDARVQMAMRNVVGSPSDWYSWLMLGNALEVEGRGAASKAAYKVGLDHLPSPREAEIPVFTWRLLVHALVHTDNEQLEKNWMRYLPETQCSSAWQWLQFELETQPPRFIKVADRYLADRVHGGCAACFKGVSLTNAGDWDGARQTWETGLKSFATHEELNYQLARFLLERGDTAAAEPAVRRLPEANFLKTLFPFIRSRDVLPTANYEHESATAYAQELAGNWDEAERTLHKLSSSDGSWAVAYPGPVLELAAHGVASPWMERALDTYERVQWRSRDRDVIDSLAGIFSKLPVPRRFEVLFNRKTVPVGFNEVPNTVRPLSLSRCGQLQDAVRELLEMKPTQLSFDGLDPHDVALVTEVLARATFHEIYWPGSLGAQAVRLKSCFAVLDDVKTGSVWSYFRRGQFKEAERAARRNFISGYPRDGWALCGIWSAHLSNDRKCEEDWRNRIMAMVRFRRQGLWLLREARRVAEMSQPTRN